MASARSSVPPPTSKFSMCFFYRTVKVRVIARECDSFSRADISQDGEGADLENEIFGKVSEKYSQQHLHRHWIHPQIRDIGLEKLSHPCAMTSTFTVIGVQARRTRTTGKKFKRGGEVSPAQKHEALLAAEARRARKDIVDEGYKTIRTHYN